MTNVKVDLKDFIRNFVNKIPKNRDRKKPLICLEFSERGTGRFNSRIAIYRIESLNIIWYKFTDERRDMNSKDWTVRERDWKVANIIPPPLTQKLSPAGFGDYSSLAVIQVEHFNE